MKWTRTAAALIAVIGMTATAVPAHANACKKRCDAQAQACSRGKSDTTPCTKAWMQCKKACARAKPSSAATPAAPTKK